MVATELDDTTVRARDRMDNVVEVETVGWRDADRSYSFPEPQDAVVSGRATELSMSASFPDVYDLADGPDGDSERVDPESSRRLDRGAYRVEAEGPLQLALRFEGPATLSVPEEGRVALSFDQPTVVSIGVRSLVRFPRETVTVPPTTAGLARGISQLSASIRSTDTTRAAEGNRQHPPRLALGDAVDVPDTVAEHAGGTGIEIRLPDRLELLFPAAPLAYYLGADVEIAPGSEPVVRAADGSFSHRLSADEFGRDAASLLRRVYHLDNLLRFDQHDSSMPTDLDLLSLLPFDPAGMDARPLADRVDRYLDVDFERMVGALPDWHFVSYVEPTPENATALPSLLRYMSAVYLPGTAPEAPGGPGGAPLSNTLAARARDGSPHGTAVAWLAPSDPPDDAMFAPSPASYEHAHEFLDRNTNTGRIVVVANDPGRASVAADAAETYRRHGPDSVDVDVLEALPRARLTELFESGADFVHFVGPCADGLGCPDGRLPPSALERSAVRLFFLDGPRSAGAGAACIDAGSAGGFVRDGGDGPLDPAVRECLLGLFTRGCTVDQASRYVARSGAGRGDVRAVGDGFQQLTRTMKLYCTPASVESVGPNRFRVDAYPYIPEAGYIWRPGLPSLGPQLCGRPFRFTVTGPQLATLTEREHLVLVHDDGVHWRRDRDLFFPVV